MHFCEVTVRLGGSLVHTVPKKIVSVPEIKVLQVIHGSDAVVDIRPFGRGYINVENHKFVADAKSPFDHAQERARLETIYEANNLDDEGQGLISRLFGPFAPLPERLSDIGIDPHRDAAELRAKADAAAKALEGLGEEIAAVESDEDKAFDEVAASNAAKERRAAREGKQARA